MNNLGEHFRSGNETLQGSCGVSRCQLVCEDGQTHFVVEVLNTESIFRQNVLLLDLCLKGSLELPSLCLSFVLDDFCVTLLFLTAVHSEVRSLNTRARLRSRERTSSSALPSSMASFSPSSWASLTSTCVRPDPPPRGKSISSGALNRLDLTSVFSGSSSGAFRFLSEPPVAALESLGL